MSQNKLNILEKNKITIFSFCMTFLVIFIHSINDKDNVFQKFIIENVYEYTIPSFFLLSGFLFFINADSFKIVITKLEKRIRSLLIPFFMWNTIYYIIYAICRTDVSFNIYSFYDALVHYRYNLVFWYLYQLMLIMCFCPILYFILKNKYLSYIVLIILNVFILIGVNIKIVNSDAIIYFYVGSILSKSYNERKFNIINKKNIICCMFVYVICLIIYEVMNANLNRLVNITNYFYYVSIFFRIMERIFGSIMLFCVLDYVFDYTIVKNYMKCNFFIYAMHYIIIRVIFIFTNILKLIIKNDFVLNILLNIIFFVTPIISIYIIYKLLNLLKNKFYNYYILLTGGM